MFGMSKTSNNANDYNELNINNQSKQVNMQEDNVIDSIYQKSIDIYYEDTEAGITREIY